MTQEKKISLPEFYGIKAGMTRIFDENGNHVPVTVIKLIPNFISQVKTAAKDGYTAYQLAYGEKREKLLSVPSKGVLKKAGISHNACMFGEVRIDNVSEESLGCEVSYESFTAATYIDVTGSSKGKGFQGVIKRHHFAGGPMAHGSHFHRHSGAIGNRATPARVFPHKRMPGQMGSDKVTTQNLKIVDVNAQEGYLLIKGSVPGSKNGYVKITKAIKKVQ